MPAEPGANTRTDPLVWKRRISTFKLPETATMHDFKDRRRSCKVVLLREVLPDHLPNAGVRDVVRNESSLPPGCALAKPKKHRGAIGWQVVVGDALKGSNNWDHLAEVGFA